MIETLTKLDVASNRHFRHSDNFVLKQGYFFSVRESIPGETRDSSPGARLKCENEKKMQLIKSWNLKLHKRTCLFSISAGCTVLEQS